MSIDIEELSFECIVGILEFERLTPQRVIINSTIEYTFKDGSFLDYAKVVEDIKDTMIKGEFLLLEDALEALSSTLLKKYTDIEKLHLKITKPDILKDCRVSLSASYFC